MRRKRRIVENIPIVDVADRGKAVGKDEEGRVYMVNEGVPGDRVNILVRKKRKSYIEGRVVGYTSYSDLRIEAKCQHFGVCGGCKWQHMDYDSQKKFKSQTVANAVSRLAGLSSDIVEPILGADPIFRYRNKLEYSFSSKRWLTEEEVRSDAVIEQSPALGFHRPGTFDKIVDIFTCHLQDERSDDIRNFLRDYSKEHEISYYDPKAHTGYLRNIIVRNTAEDDWMIILSVAFEDDDVLFPLLDTLKEKFPFVTSLHYVVNQKRNDTILDQDIVCYHGNPYIIERLRDVRYKIGPKSFFQTNTSQAIQLFDVVTEMADFKGGENVYDLYTGLGSIALYIADKVGSVVGIEEVEPAILDARVNAELNDVKNAQFLAGDVKDILTPSFSEKYGRPDIVITDPPRVGMHSDVVETLLALEAPKIVYVSCNPATQARDLKLLAEKYDVLRVRPVDMFPHTHHIESVALLHLRKQNP